MQDFIITYQWEIFIGLEILSLLFLLAFLIIRYALKNQKLSHLFLGLFILPIVLEGILAIFVYQKTGIISTFQIIILLFIAYACTFGIIDFRNLDLFIKRKVGEWQGVDLLTEAEKQRIKLNKNPKYKAKQSRRWWYGHTIVFIIAHVIFWTFYGNSEHDFMYYLTDFSWWSDVQFGNGPFQHEMIDQISKLWILVYAIDTVISWSYTLFPAKEKSENNG